MEISITDGDHKTFNQCKKAKRQFDSRHGIKRMNCNFSKLASSLDCDNIPDVLDGQPSRIVSWGVYLIETHQRREITWVNMAQFPLAYDM